MNYSPVKDTLRKTGTLMVVAIVLGLGLVWFNSHRNLLTHQHPYYARMYADIVRYKVSTWTDKLWGNPTQASNGAQYATSVPVLLYHGIRPTASGENISLAEFDNQLIALKRAGWQTISIQDFHDFMRAHKKLPAKSFLMTFDDARKDSYYPVDPMLSALGYRATMFVITKSSFNPVENKFYLNAGELTAMKDNGRWDLQPHAAYGHYLYPINAAGKLGHFYDTKLWLTDKGRLETNDEFSARTLGDLKLAKSEMQQQLGSSGIAFAFPFNEFGGGSVNYPGAEPALMANVASVYPIAFYQIWPNKGNTQNYAQDSSFLMKRILIDDKVSSGSLMDTLNASSPKALPYSSPMDASTGSWVFTWGDHHWDSNGLTLTATSDGTGAAAFLDGAGAWQNYSATAHIKLHKGLWARVIGRFHDDKNYTSCTFSDSSVLMEQAVNGTIHELGEADMHVPVSDFQAGLSVNGTHMDCKINGQFVLASSEVAPSLAFGGIGFGSYGPDKNNSQVSISNVQVDALR